MNKETLDHLELCIFAEQTHDVNFQNIAKELFKEVCFQKKEIERLNNIINELEKWINTEIAIHIDDDILPIVYECILSKLKELKEGK